MFLWLETSNLNKSLLDVKNKNTKFELCCFLRNAISGSYNVLLQAPDISISTSKELLLLHNYRYWPEGKKRVWQKEVRIIQIHLVWYN